MLIFFNTLAKRLVFLTASRHRALQITALKFRDDSIRSEIYVDLKQVVPCNFNELYALT